MHARSTTGALAALAIGATVAAGCGGSSGGGSQQGARPAASTSQPAPQQSHETVKQGGRQSATTDGSGSVSQSSSQSTQSGSSSSISQSSQQSSSNGHSLSTFGGTGASTLSFNVQRPSTLVWTNSDGGRFTLRDPSGKIDVSSTKHTGSISLAPGTYRDVKVDGKTWAIVIRPR